MLSFLRTPTVRLLLASLLVSLGAAAQAQQVLRVTAIPDESPTELARKAAPLVKYLEGKLGMKVEFTPVTDYAASVETLINGKVDLAWFGGFTFVQASVRSGGKVIPLVQREEDERFRSVFITTDPSIKTLADLKGKKVGVGQGSVFEQQAKAVGGITVKSYPAAPENLQDLAFGRVDAALNDSLMVAYLLKNSKLPIQAGARVG
eukprot:gene39430-51976_t